MEHMINERLVHFFESKNIFTVNQKGFRKGKSTIDPTVCLEDVVRKAQINKETMVSVIFHVEKAYHMMWREVVLIKLHLTGLRGRILNWIIDFLDKRKIQVKICTEVSTQYSRKWSSVRKCLESYSVVWVDLYLQMMEIYGRKGEM